MTSPDKAKFFDRWAPHYDHLFPSVIYQAIHQRLLEFVTLPQSAHVLDLGCGTGKLLRRLAQQFPDLQGTGCDFSPIMIHQAQQQNPEPSLTFVQGNAAALPFPDRQFDAVFSTISFAHYRDPKAVFAEIDRVLKPGGQFYWVDPAPWKGYSGVLQLPVTPGGFRLYSLDQREQLGRSVHFSTATHHYLLGPVVLTRFLKASFE